jgi:hypothetical protein
MNNFKNAIIWECSTMSDVDYTWWRDDQYEAGKEELDKAIRNIPKYH